MSTVPSFINLLNTHASVARYYRGSDTGIPCVCRTPEGFRDAELHIGFRSYGPTLIQATSGGNIPDGSTVQYAFVSNVNGVRMSPQITSNEATANIGDFQTTITLIPINLGNFIDGVWEVYRSDNGGPFLRLPGSPPLSDLQYTDNNIRGNGTMVPPVLCNEAGLIPSAPVDVIVKAFVQPIQSTRATRLSTEYIQEIFGNVEADDHLGIFPVTWGGSTLQFGDWSQSGDDFIEYDGQRFFVINANLIPDPGDGNPAHHWEIGLRLIRSDGLVS